VYPRPEALKKLCSTGLLACRLMWKLHSMCSACASRIIRNTAAQSCMRQYIWPLHLLAGWCCIGRSQNDHNIANAKQLYTEARQGQTMLKKTHAVQVAQQFPVFDRPPCKAATVMQQHNSVDTQQPRTFSFA